MISLITPSIAGSYASGHGSSPSTAFSHSRTGASSRRPWPRRLPEEAYRPSQKPVEAPEIGRYPDADWVEDAKPGSQQRPEPGQVGSAPDRHCGETAQAGSEESAAPGDIGVDLDAYGTGGSQPALDVPVDLRTDSPLPRPRQSCACAVVARPKTSGVQQRVYSPPNAYRQAITPQLA